MTKNRISKGENADIANKTIKNLEKRREETKIVSLKTMKPTSHRFSSKAAFFS